MHYLHHSDQPINDCRLIEKYCGDILQILERLQAGECTLKGLVEFKLFQCRQLFLDIGKYSMSEVRPSFQLKNSMQQSTFFEFCKFSLSLISKSSWWMPGQYWRKTFLHQSIYRVQWKSMFCVKFYSTTGGNINFFSLPTKNITSKFLSEITYFSMWNCKLLVYTVRAINLILVNINSTTIYSALPCYNVA